MNGIVHVPIADARALVERCMAKVGHTQDDAVIIADHLIDCELRGLSYGGLPRALSVVERIRRTPTPPRPIAVLRETPVSATLDGGDQVGYLVARRATEIAIDKAAKAGLAIVGATDTWYTGMFSYYMEMATRRGFAAMAGGSSAPYVAPHGGGEGRFGTNPIAFGFPSDTGPVIWDAGTSAVMVGEVILQKRRGESLAPGLAFDREGAPTQDPGAALDGAFAVWGGDKGSGLAMMVQLLGMMCGADAAPPRTAGCGFLVMVTDPAILTSADDFKRRVSAYAASVRGTRPLDPGRPVRVPFDRSAAERERHLADGTIRVPEPIHQALLGVADDAGG